MQNHQNTYTRQISTAKKYGGFQRAESQSLDGIITGAYDRKKYDNTSVSPTWTIRDGPGRQSAVSSTQMEGPKHLNHIALPESNVVYIITCTLPIYIL